MDPTASNRNTREIDIGGTKVGGNAPVVVQSMCATRTMDVDATVAQSHQLARAGAARSTGCTRLSANAGVVSRADHIAGLGVCVIGFGLK